MIAKILKSCLFLLITITSGCGATYRQDISTHENVSIVQSSENSSVKLTAVVYINPTRSTLWLSGNARNTAGNPLIAGHVHAILFGAQSNVLADRQFALFENAGTPRLQRSSKKKFGGEIVVAIPTDFRLEVAYHTASH